jgi:hypothetical protein
MVTFALTTVPIGSCSRDPIGYLDGPNQYTYGTSSPLVYSDAFGYTSCRGTKTFLVDNRGCNYYADIGNGYYGFRFIVDIEFKDHCCNCCSYQQYLLYKTYDLKMRHVDNNRNPTGPWKPVPLPYPNYLVDYVEEGKEDCAMRNGVWTCYGDRTKPFPENMYAKCKFHSQDTPGVHLPTLLKDLYPLELVEFSRLEFILTINWRFLLNVIDTCNHGNVVESRILEQTCSEDFWKK